MGRFPEVNKLLAGWCGKVGKGQERSGKVRNGQERSGKIRQGQERLGKVRKSSGKCWLGLEMQDSMWRIKRTGYIRGFEGRGKYSDRKYLHVRSGLRIF